MKIFRFSFNTQYAKDLRDAVLDRQKQSLEVRHTDSGIKGDYPAWDRICTIMDRLDDTLDYLNTMELGKCLDRRSAFDFYDFLNNCYVVIECIKKIGQIFRLDAQYITETESSNAVFGTAQSEQSNDGKYFEYIRSLCSVHPIETSRQKMFLNGSKFHCCPFVTWNNGLAFSHRQESDLEAWVYTSDKGGGYLIIPLYVLQFETYLNKWIALIPKIIEAKNSYTDEVYDELRATPIKSLSDLNYDIIAYLSYLKGEYIGRFDYGNDGMFDNCIRLFSIRLSDKRNIPLLEKYRNAIRYALQFTKNELQNMSYEGYENNGIKHPEPGIETTLLDELVDIWPYGGALSAFSYELGKIYCLEPDYTDPADVHYARRLLDAPKELLNDYVFFSNTEPDEERIVLVKLALYLEALTRKSLLNRNIPNYKKYRVRKLTKQEYSDLLSEEPSAEQGKNTTNKFHEFLKQYGG